MINFDPVWRMLNANRVKAALGLMLCAASLTLFGIRQYVYAHAGHGSEEVGEYDLDAPRAVFPETAQHMGLKTTEVAMKPMEDVIGLNGVVKPLPDRHRAVVSRLAGKVLEVFKQVGDAVKKDEPIAQIDSPELARGLYEVRKLEVEFQKLLLEIERSKSEAARLTLEVETAKAQADFAAKELARAESLSGDGAVSRKELEQRVAERTQAEGILHQREIDRTLAQTTAAGLTKQSEALKVSREALLVMNNIDPAAFGEQTLTSTLQIKAEADGVVVTRSAMPGHWVQAGQSLLEVADYRVVQIEGELPESLIARVRGRKTDKVRIRTPADPKFLGEGKIRFIAPQLEPAKRTAHLIVDAPNESGLLRGEMWVDLSIVLEERKDAIVIPRSAELVQGPMHFVFIEKVSGDSDKGILPVYQKQDINPGTSNDLYVQVKDGVYPGDKVVSQGAYSLTQLRPKAPKRAAAEASPEKSGAETKDTEKH